jgi:hypothetical protein
MPPHQDAYISDVVVTLDRNDQIDNLQTIERLKREGMTISTADVEQGVVEGCIESSKLCTIDRMPGIEYVRSVFTYVADFPSDDPRDRDGVDREATEE